MGSLSGNMGVLPSTRMVGINYNFEHFHSTLPIQHQPAFNTFNVGSLRTDCSIDQKISTDERLSSAFIVSNFTNDVIPEAP